MVREHANVAGITRLHADDAATIDHKTHTSEVGIHVNEANPPVLFESPRPHSRLGRNGYGPTATLQRLGSEPQKASSRMLSPVRT